MESATRCSKSSSTDFLARTSCAAASLSSLFQGIHSQWPPAHWPLIACKRPIAGRVSGENTWPGYLASTSLRILSLSAVESLAPAAIGSKALVTAAVGEAVGKVVLVVVPRTSCHRMRNLAAVGCVSHSSASKSLTAGSLDCKRESQRSKPGASVKACANTAAES